MNARPLKRYREPKYPTKLQVLGRPELLANHVPSMWRRTAGMAGIVGLLLAANGCVEPRTDVSPAAGTGTDGQGSAPVAVNEGSVNQPATPVGTVSIGTPKSFVAPIFHHGKGRGVVGCVAIAPPVFLSEEEALQVILEELKQAGVSVSRTNAAMENLAIEQEFRRFERAWQWKTTNSTGQVTTHRFSGPDSPGVVKPLEVDGLSENGSVVFEFVSEPDYSSFGGLRSTSTVHTYDMPKVAEEVAKRVAEKDESVYFGTFYDPLESHTHSDVWDANGRMNSRQAIEAATRERARSLLREQVVDFVNWLKGQGAI